MYNGTMFGSSNVNNSGSQRKPPTTPISNNSSSGFDVLRRLSTSLSGFGKGRGSMNNSNTQPYSPALVRQEQSPSQQSRISETGIPDQPALIALATVDIEPMVPTPALTPVTSYIRLDEAAGDEDATEGVWERSVKITFPKQATSPVTESQIRDKILSFGDIVEIGMKEKLALVLFAKSVHALNFACNHGGIMGEDFKIKYTGSLPIPPPDTVFPITAAAGTIRVADVNMVTGVGASAGGDSPASHPQPPQSAQSGTASAPVTSMSKAEKATAAAKMAEDLAVLARSSAISVDTDSGARQGSDGLQVDWRVVVVVPVQRINPTLAD